MLVVAGLIQTINHFAITFLAEIQHFFSEAPVTIYSKHKIYAVVERRIYVYNADPLLSFED